MDSHRWCGLESDNSFQKVRHVTDMLNQTFGGDSSVHVGIIYLAIGENGGKLTSRYLLFMPYYNPTIHGYSFNIQHPYIFARGYPSAASSEFYSWIDQKWTDLIDRLDETNNLLECSPILVCGFEDIENAAFDVIPWERSLIDSKSLSIRTQPLECWIHGPMENRSMETRILNRVQADKKTEFMELVCDGNVQPLANFLQDLMIQSNSYSFPTFQLRIRSPMTGLVPFPLKDVRLKIGGEMSAADREENVAHIPVAKPDHDMRRISFQRIWDVLFDRNVEYSQRIKNLRLSVQRQLQC